MYKCNNCETLFEEPVVKEFTDYDEFWGARVAITYEEAYCPECGNEDFDEHEVEEEEDKDV